MCAWLICCSKGQCGWHEFYSGPLESEFPTLYMQRFDAIVDLLLHKTDSDIISLQEVWFNPDYLSSLEKALSHKYHLFTAQRTQGKPDGSL